MPGLTAAGTFSYATQQTNAVATNSVPGYLIIVNSAGAFFNRLTPGTSLGSSNMYQEQFNSIQGRSDQARAFILLHELGHGLGMLRSNDSGNDADSRANQRYNNDFIWETVIRRSTRLAIGLISILCALPGGYTAKAAQSAVALNAGLECIADMEVAVYQGLLWEARVTGTARTLITIGRGGIASSINVESPHRTVQLAPAMVFEGDVRFKLLRPNCRTDACVPTGRRGSVRAMQPN